LTSPVKVLLFDLDGTLLLSGGAGMRAMSEAIREQFGVEDAFRDIVPDGKTDPVIFREMLRTCRIPIEDEAAAIKKLAGRYEQLLTLEMPKSPGARLMPGVVELLEALREKPGVLLGLLTGNFEATAKIKLARFDLNGFFSFGAFATDSEIRARLVPIAVAKAEAATGLDIGLGRHIFVIGDTPLDVKCALDNGATAVGVATAKSSVEELQKAGAHIVFSDLSDMRGVLSALEVSDG